MMENWEDIDQDRIDEEHKPIYREYYKSIRTRVTPGKLKTTFHFLVIGEYTRSMAKDFMAAIEMELGTIVGYKVNAAFGYILKNHRTNELRYFHPSRNNMLYDLPAVIKHRRDLNKLLDDMENEDARAYVAAQRPSTVWRFEKIVVVRFDVYKPLSAML